MTIEETSQCYPMEILWEYKSWGLCGAVKEVIGAWQYDNSNLEKLSMSMTLHEISFSNKETEICMKLLIEESTSDDARLQMLERKRIEALDEIYCRENQLARLDYLRYKIRQKAEKKIPQTKKAVNFHGLIFMVIRTLSNF